MGPTSGRPGSVHRSPRAVMRTVAGLLVMASCLGLFIAAIIASRVTGTIIGDPLLALAIVLLGIVGGFIIWRSDNRIGIVLAVAGISGALAGLAAGLGSGDSAHDALVGNSFLDAGPARLIFIALGHAGFFTFAVTLFGLLPLLFPSGHVPSPRWKWLERALIGGVVAAFVSGSFKPELCAYSDVDAALDVCVPNPIGIVAMPPTEMILLLLFPGMVAAVVSLVLRYRRSTGLERLQLKWVTFSMSAFLIEAVVVEILLVETLDLELGPLSNPTIDLFGLLVPMIPISIGIAVLRYRLYEIDRLVSRTVSYGIVLAFLAGGFGLVVALPVVLAGSEQTPSWVVATATLVAAALFSPLRRRVQSAVDRRFNRSSYDAQQVVDVFGRSIRDGLDLNALADSLCRVASDVVQPSRVGLWLPEREAFRNG